MQNLSANIGVHVKPVFQSKKIGQVFDPKEKEQSMRSLICSLILGNPCDADHVKYTTRPLHQRISEHKYSAIGKRIEEHGLTKSALEDKQFSIWRNADRSLIAKFLKCFQ